MDSKTPRFNEALGKILDNLKPHAKECQECNKDFEIMTEDIEFYKRLQVPPPTLCWECRYQRRHGYRISFLPIFYKKACGVPGHRESIISYYSGSNSIKVYDKKYYFSDKWEATQFFINYTVEEEFFQQYKKFALKNPHQSLYNDPKSVNSDYSIATLNVSDCYYTVGAYLSEKIYYSYLPIKSNNCISIAKTQNCERCFDSVDLNHSYDCISVNSSNNCVEGKFLYDCRNCQNCFMSANLRNKSYVFRGQQLSKKKYQEKIRGINFGSRDGYERLKREFDELVFVAVKKDVILVKTDKCIGDDIYNSKNCFLCFLVIDGSENNRYVAISAGIINSMDAVGVASSTRLYEVVDIVNCDVINFSTKCRHSFNLEYCFECKDCENCFACFGLKNKKYHIFNKEYTKTEYWKRVDELKTRMLERGEYGEFFPLKDSPFPYQDSNAQVEFPMTEEEIKKKGWCWQDEVELDVDLTKVEIIDGKDVSDNIEDISDGILKTPIICKKTRRPFKILSFELEFYRKLSIPLPVIHPLERAKDLFKYHRSYKLYNAKCVKCHVKIKTVHNPKRVYNIYCEKCYNKKVV